MVQYIEKYLNAQSEMRILPSFSCLYGAGHKQKREKDMNYVQELYCLLSNNSSSAKPFLCSVSGYSVVCQIWLVSTAPNLIISLWQ